MATDSETMDGVLMDDDNASYDKAAKRLLYRKIGAMSRFKAN